MKLKKTIIFFIALTSFLILFGYNGKTALGGTTLFPTQGGTGTSVSPSYGDVMVGTSGGVYAPRATSTLGIVGSGGSSLHIDGGGYVYPQGGDYHSAPYYVATSTTATTSLQKTKITGAIDLLGEYFTNFTTYVRSLFTAGTGINIASGVISSTLGTVIDLVSEVTGVLPDANVADDITLTNITQITNRAISFTTGTLQVSRGGTGLTSGYNNTNWDTAYTNRITSATYPLSIATNNISTVATSSLNLLVGSFLSPNISQWTNDSGYLTSYSETDPVVKAINGIVKSNGTTISSAVSGTDYEVPITFSTGLTRSTNTVTVNTSQNIGTLSNLTTNGFIKTSGGTGLLSVDTNTYLTGNQTITLSGDVSGSGTTAITTTIGANAVALGTDTTGNYVATIADSGNSTISVIGSGTETAGITLDAIGLNCTDCLGTTEISDIYLLNTGDVATGVYDFGGATSFEIPNGTAPAISVLGQIAFDSTDGQLIIDDGTNDLVVRTEEKIFAFTLASTSPEFSSGGQIAVPLEKDGYTVTNIKCYVQAGTSVVATLTDNTNAMDSLTCATTATTDDGTIANNTVIADELMYVNIGTVTGAVDYLTFSVFGRWSRE